ncbi:hypothetical protein LTR70_004761 [Exophiala xenobiotica]|uniref:Uncharacterized protein n=1 Tax=Lithohypha guttulata TaxID=1690604 RepID=A0ABR0KCB3_9EURO|nr:hypothetical protein LTR24_004253 [Lithohypha guttulata]KAK5319851.1 hypothetical protein LTR70_004761 [Exophiala xenobiotica]
MAANISQLSPTRLAHLAKSKKRITIQHKQLEDDFATVVFDGYRLDLAVTFSGAIREKFPDVKSIIAGQMQFTRPPTMVTITGGCKDSVKKALEWAMRCCDGKGLRSYIPAENLPFLVARADKAASEVLQMSAYTNKIGTYIQQRLAGRFTPEEVKALHKKGTYLTLRLDSGIPAEELKVLLQTVKEDDPTFTALVDHVANRTITDMQTRYTEDQNPNNNSKPTQKKRTILPSDQYRGVRFAFPDPFGNAVDAIITEWQKSKRVTDKNRVTHKNVSLQPVRKTGKYQYKLNLAEVGVTSRSFTSGTGKRAA